MHLQFTMLIAYDLMWIVIFSDNFHQDRYTNLLTAYSGLSILVIISIKIGVLYLLTSYCFP